MSPGHLDEPSTLMTHLMGRADFLRRYVEAKIPSRLRRTVSADDILQDIWLTAFRSKADIGSLEVEEFNPWLTRVANRRLADAIRRAATAKRGGREVILYAKQQNTSFVDLFGRVRSPQVTPSREVSTMEAVQAVQIALAALPEDYRTAITLRYINGSSCSQVAEAMRRSHGAVWSLLYRGKRRLRGLVGSLGKFFSEDGTNIAPHSLPQESVL